MASKDMTGSGRARRRTVLGVALAAGGGAVTAAGTTGCERRDPRPNQDITEPVALGPAEAVPVGGARLYRAEKVLVCQPKAGEFRAFSAVCPHAGCVLSALRDDKAICSCHGSTFDPETGAVLQGPADKPLPELELDVETSDGAMTARP